jgi:NAD(P)-dependent dehydrogenase (short-subunit alcohol dehydrogenase family)
VVVNDLGGSMEGEGADTAPASTVAAEIEDTGGTAVADAHDVADPDGARALIDTALRSFGRVDIVVNNAGIVRWAGPPEVDLDNLHRHLSVHVDGSFNTAMAAWPHLAAQRYGRIVMTTSTGIFGLATNTSYATAKAGIIGLTRSLAVAGTRHGITVNAIAPAAFTRMAGAAEDGRARQDAGQDARAQHMAPALVAPLVAYLAHEDCPVTGEVYAAGARRFARVLIASAPGYVHAAGTPTIEDVADHWAAINDPTGAVCPADLMAWSRAFLDHLPPGG